MLHAEPPQPPGRPCWACRAAHRFFSSRLTPFAGMPKSLVGPARRSAAQRAQHEVAAQPQALWSGTTGCRLQAGAGRGSAAACAHVEHTGQRSRQGSKGRESFFKRRPQCPPVSTQVWCSTPSASQNLRATFSRCMVSHQGCSRGQGGVAGSRVSSRKPTGSTSKFDPVPLPPAAPCAPCGWPPTRLWSRQPLQRTATQQRKF